MGQRLNHVLLGGYASVCEGFGGFRYVNGFADPETGLPDGRKYFVIV
jgi:hypothetical protein